MIPPLTPWVSHGYRCRVCSYQQVNEGNADLLLACAALCIVRATSSRKQALKSYTTLLWRSSSIRKSPRLTLADTIVFKTVSSRKSITIKFTSNYFPCKLLIVNLCDNNYLSTNVSLTFVMRICVPLKTGNTRRVSNLRFN